ncbi:hypothetical protein Y032_1144g3684 [Ancylostoma ceylanicum]|uniref:Uncharacterized protein n=1 Tax=Ancylostoma ceylanicum TaxID=53326 RepID=A0A016W5N0_9BILA|nr:hypothetical protein Y032_1144g3684 [Ancylostoma ceylanicum]
MVTVFYYCEVAYRTLIFPKLSAIARAWAFVSVGLPSFTNKSNSDDLRKPKLVRLRVLHYLQIWRQAHRNATSQADA